MKTTTPLSFVAKLHTNNLLSISKNVVKVLMLEKHDPVIVELKKILKKDSNIKFSQEKKFVKNVVGMGEQTAKISIPNWIVRELELKAGDYVQIKISKLIL